MLLTLNALENDPILFETPIHRNFLIASLRQSSFERDGKECMAKLRRVVRIPKEGMVRVGAYYGRQARIGNIGKSKVRRILLYCIQQAEYMQADDMNALQILLYRQKFAQPLVSCRARRRSKTHISSRRRQQAHIEQIGNHEMPRAGPPEQQFAIRQPFRDVLSKRLRRAGSGVQNVVSAALQDVESIGIGFAPVLAQIQLYLLGDARNRSPGNALSFRDPSPTEGIIRPSQQRSL